MNLPNDEFMLWVKTAIDISDLPIEELIAIIKEAQEVGIIPNTLSSREVAIEVLHVARDIMTEFLLSANSINN